MTNLVNIKQWKHKLISLARNTNMIVYVYPAFLKSQQAKIELLL